MATWSLPQGPGHPVCNACGCGSLRPSFALLQWLPLRSRHLRCLRVRPDYSRVVVGMPCRATTRTTSRPAPVVHPTSARRTFGTLYENHSTSNVLRMLNAPSSVKYFSDRTIAVIDKTIQTFFGGECTDGNSSAEEEAGTFMEQLKDPGAYKESQSMKNALMVFYDELVKYYADNYIRIAKKA